VIDLGPLHFLRPAWLTALLALPLLAAWLWRRGAQGADWQRAIDAHLLPYLLDAGNTARRRGLAMLAALAYVLAVLALAGPAWRQVDTPSWQTREPLVVAVDLSSATLAGDLVPSRLAQLRARLSRLLATHRDGPIALVAFADDAFTVAPITDDAANVALFVDALEPSVMPVDGQSPARAIAWSRRLIERAGFAHGRIVVVTDHADADARRAASEARAAGDMVSVLGLGMPGGANVRMPGGAIAHVALDEATLPALAEAGGGPHARPASTGEGHRVTLEDVRGFAAGAKAEAAPVAAAGAPVARVQGRAPIVIAPPAGTSASLEDRRPFVGVRRKIAERMQASKNTAAHFTFVEECDVGRIKELRKRLQPAAEKQGVKLTFLPFIVKAVVAALKKFPVLNSALDESSNELVTRRYYHIGIAASTDQGLMVPVVKDADKKSILEIAREIDRLGNAARSGSIASADLAGSTFTITSLGAQGGLFATPVLNFPEVGILGVHQIKKKPVVKNDQIVIGEIMLLSLSFDHRIVDGHVGAAFAYEIIGALENPEAMFLEMS